MYATEHDDPLPSFITAPILTARQCERLIEATRSLEPSPAVRALSSGESIVDLNFRSCDNFFFPIGHPIYNLIVGQITGWMLTTQDQFAVDLFPHRSQMLPEIMVNRYRADAEVPGHLDWHNDLGATGALRTRKLSLSILLNDPSEWTGGELDISMGRAVQPLANVGAGHGVLFPSYVYHRVRPVTRGARYSVVAWFRGPAYR